MIFKNKFVRAGRMLCRHRIYFPIVFIAMLVLYLLFTPAVVFSRYPLLTDILSGLFILLSFRIRWSAENRESNTLQAVIDAKGIYSVIRFPYYLSDFLLMFGMTLFVGSFTLLLVFVLISIIIIERMLMYEEGISFNKLGEVYADWYRSTNAIIPIIWNFRGSVSVKSITLKLISMLPSLLFTLFTLNIIYIVKYYRVTSTFSIDYPLLLMLLITIVCMFATRVVVRR